MAAKRYLAESWHGSHRECFDFADRAAQDAPAGSLVQALPVRAAFAYLTDGCGPEVPRERLDAAADRAIGLSGRFPGPTPGRPNPEPADVRPRPARPPGGRPAQLRLTGPYATSFPWGRLRTIPLGPFPARCVRTCAVGASAPGPRVRSSTEWARRNVTYHRGPLGFCGVTTVRLPLFPLNTVLFPGLVLPLNVFEERYRAMMRDLLKTSEDEPRRFAVVAIRDGHEVAPSAPGMPDPTAAARAGPGGGLRRRPGQGVPQGGLRRRRGDHPGAGGRHASRCWRPGRPGCGCCPWTPRARS